MIVKTNGARILSFAAAVGKKEGEGLTATSLCT